jgi:hypothetical protein
MMGPTSLACESCQEQFVAELAAAAYQAALRHGLKGPFIDVELELWQALRAVVAARLTGEGPLQRM